MARFEQYLPKLRPGRVIPQGQKIIYETEAPFDQLVLPVEMIDFILMCDGKRSIAQIIEALYHRGGNIQFKSIFKTISYLKERGFLENGSELEIAKSHYPDEDIRFLGSWPFWEIPIGQRIFNDKSHPVIFYILSMAAMIGAIFSFHLWSPKWHSFSFLYIENSYLKGILFTAVATSIILSLKNILKCALLIFLTGRAYNFSIAFNGVAIYFRIKSDSLFLVMNKFYILLFHLGVIFSYFPIVMAFHFVFPNTPFFHETMSLAFLLFLLDLNPFHESELTHLVRTIFNDDTVSKLSKYLKERPLLSLIHPFEVNKEYNLYFFFSHFSLAWGVGFFYCIMSAVQMHTPLLSASMQEASLSEKLLAWGAASFLLTSGLIVIFNVGKLLYISLFAPLSKTVLKHVKSKQSSNVEKTNHHDLMRTLETLPLFGHLSSELLNMIVSRSIVKKYEKQTPIIIQGEAGTHLYILLDGRLSVRKRGLSGSVTPLSEIRPVSIFGEIAVIEETPRTAEVIATENSTVLEIPARMLRQITTEHQFNREMEAFRHAIMVNQFFSSAPVFRDLPENLIQLFIMRGKIETFEQNQTLFKQGDSADGFFLLLRGSVGVTVNGHPVARIQQGGFFGEVSMIADIPRTGTVMALTHVEVLKISRDAFWEILSMDFRIAMFIETVGEMRVKEDVEIINNKPRVA